MTCSVFIGTSLDGFIARLNGSFDFLPECGGEPHGYNEFIATIDALVIGRNTFETVLAFPEWPYGDKRVVVLSSRPIDFSKVRGGVVEQMGGPPAEIVSELAASGAHHLYIDGGITIQNFLRAGLIRTADHYSSASAHRRRHSAIWHPAAGCALTSRCHAALSQRLG